MDSATRKYSGAPGRQCRGTSAQARSRATKSAEGDLAWVAANGTVPPRWADRKDAAAVLEGLQAQLLARAARQAAQAAQAA